MRLDTVIELVDMEERVNENGFFENVILNRKSVFAKKENVRRAEFYSATQSGYVREKAAFSILSLEYESQKFVEYQSKTYMIIRSYEKGNFTELFCQAYQERE
jgi:hypothetical protein